MSNTEGLHKHAFWLYGVIVGLAIKDALEAVAPTLINPQINGAWHATWLGLRMFVFLLLIIRFYFGSAIYFDSAHINSDAAVNYPTKNYPIDFFCGFVHFMFFFVLAYTINPSDKSYKLFQFFLGIVLSYDLFWYLATKDYPTTKLIKIWTFINLSTGLLSGFLYLFMRHVINTGYTKAEAVALLPVIIVSFLDIIDLVKEESYLKRWFQRIIN